MALIFILVFALLVSRRLAPENRPWAIAGAAGVVGLIGVTLGLHALLDFNAITGVSTGVPLLFFGMMSSEKQLGDSSPTDPEILPYWLSYILAVIVFLAEMAITLILGTYAAGNGAALGLTPQIQAWLGVIGPLLGALAGFLPAVSHTPARRVAELLRASRGMFPRDARRA